MSKLGHSLQVSTEFFYSRLHRKHFNNQPVSSFQYQSIFVEMLFQHFALLRLVARIHFVHGQRVCERHLHFISVRSLLEQRETDQHALFGKSNAQFARERAR